MIRVQRDNVHVTKLSGYNTRFVHVKRRAQNIFVLIFIYQICTAGSPGKCGGIKVTENITFAAMPTEVRSPVAQL